MIHINERPCQAEWNKRFCKKPEARATLRLCLLYYELRPLLMIGCYNRHFILPGIPGYRLHTNPLTSPRVHGYSRADGHSDRHSRAGERV